MEHFETLAERDRFRVIAVPDELAEAPYDDGGAHTFHVEASHYADAPTVTVQHTSMQRDTETSTLRYALDQAFARWEHDGDVIERYLRIFHDVVFFDYVSSNNYGHGAGSIYGIVTRGLAEAQGRPADAGNEHELDEWQAWLDGDVYSLVTQQLVTWTPDDDDFEDREDWETVDSLSGLYGFTDYLREEAERMLEEVAPLFMLRVFDLSHGNVDTFHVVHPDNVQTWRELRGVTTYRVETSDITIKGQVCAYCSHVIDFDPDDECWVAPDAGTDVENGDGIWRDYCPDNHTERAAPHEPSVF